MQGLSQRYTDDFCSAVKLCVMSLLQQTGPLSDVKVTVGKGDYVDVEAGLFNRSVVLEEERNGLVLCPRCRDVFSKSPAQVKCSDEQPMDTYTFIHSTL